MSIAFNGMPIGVTASSKIILLTNIIFRDNFRLNKIAARWPARAVAQFYFIDN